MPHLYCQRAARAGMSGARPRLLANEGKRMPRYQQSIAFERCATINRRLRSRFARVNGDLPLLSALNSAILAPKPSASGECRVKGLTIMSNSIYNGWRMEDVWLDK